MTETVEITNYQSTFLKKKLTISSSSEPSTPDLTLISKIVPKFNLSFRIGFDLGFIESGQIRIMRNESQSLLPDNDLTGLQEINTGIFEVESNDKIDLKIWNTNGGSFDVIVLIFINSESDGTFVDPIALLEGTSKTNILLDSAQPVGTYTQEINMQGYKSLILTMGVKTGLGNNVVIHSNPDSWPNLSNTYDRSNAGANLASGGTDKTFILDCGQEITGELCLAGRQTGASSAHYEVETSLDDITYNNVITSPAITTTTELYKSTSHTFRYIKVIGVVDSGTPTFVVTGLGLVNMILTTIDLKFQKSSDGIMWEDYIISTEYDTVIDNNDNVPEVFTISRDNPSNTGTVYLLPQGSGKFRIHLTITLYSGLFADSNGYAGYGGTISIEKLN